VPEPSRLAPFEEYMLFDDRPAYPMNFFLRLHFSGGGILPALQAALPSVLARHPLLSAVIRRDGRRRQWVPSPVRPTIRVVSPVNDTPWRQPDAIDLGREPGLRLSVVEDKERFQLTLQFHHACCDGLAAFAFLEELLTASLQTGRGVASLPPLDNEALRRREWFGPLPGGFLPAVCQKLAGLRHACRFLAHRPASLVPGDLGNHQAVPKNYPSMCDRQLTASESSLLRQQASGCGVTLNDLLVRDWFLAVNEWTTKRFSGSPGDWLRLCVPVSLRTEAHRGLSAANVVSMVYLDRRRKDLADPDRLLRGIHREMDEIKRLRLGEAFVAGMGMTARLPGWMVRSFGPGRCWATGLLSNLGIVLANPALPKRKGRLEIDGAVLEKIDFLPPLRPATSAVLGVFTYAGRLGFTLHYDPRSIQPWQAEEFIDALVTQLRTSIDSPARRSS
jgi:hypothetical protein